MHYKRITIGQLKARTIDVAAGLSANDRIINNPSNALLEGDQVRVLTPTSGEDLPNPQESASPPSD